MFTLNYQQQTVMERVQRQLDVLYECNEALRKKTITVCTISTAIVGIVSAAKFLPDHSTGFDVESILLSIVVFLSALMYLFATAALLPGKAPIPGSRDTDELFDEFLVQDGETAFNNFLIDSCEACNIAFDQNATNEKNLKRVLITLQIQICVLALAVGWTGFVG